MWTLEWEVRDLDVTDEELADWRRRTLSGIASEALIAEIKTRYPLYSRATFGKIPADGKAGFPINEKNTDLEIVRQIFTQSCLHCHDQAEGSAETYFRDTENSKVELARKFLNNSKKSAYIHIRSKDRLDRLAPWR